MYTFARRNCVPIYIYTCIPTHINTSMHTFCIPSSIRKIYFATSIIYTCVRMYGPMYVCTYVCMRVCPYNMYMCITLLCVLLARLQQTHTASQHSLCGSIYVGGRAGGCVSVCLSICLSLSRMHFAILHTCMYRHHGALSLQSQSHLPLRCVPV